VIGVAVGMSVVEFIADKIPAVDSVWDIVHTFIRVPAEAAMPAAAFDAVDGILNGKRYLIHDRDPLFTTAFLEMVAEVGVKSVKLPPPSPNLNAHAERFVRTIKEFCLERMISLERSRCARLFSASSSIITPSAITRVW
jgi:hypothetical protein